MRSFLRFAVIVLTLGIAAMIGCSGKKTAPPAAGPEDVTLNVPGMN